MIAGMETARITIDAARTLGGPIASDPGAAGALVTAVLQALANDTPVLIDLSGLSTLTTAFLNAVLLDVLPVTQQKSPGVVRFKVATPLQQELLKRSTEGARRRLQASSSDGHRAAG